MSQPLTLAQAPRDPVQLSDWVVTLHPDDDVAVAKRAIAPGTILVSGEGRIRARRLVPSGHKIALRQVPRDAPVHKYGEVIGKATEAIEQGDHVHVHNLVAHDFDRDYAFGEDFAPVQLVPASAQRSFLGFRRADGRVGTRNYVAVLPSVNCSSSAAAAVARNFDATEALARYPNVDGVIAFTHAGGCGAHVGSNHCGSCTGRWQEPSTIRTSPRTSFSASGARTTSRDDMIEHGRLGDDEPLVITIQEEGGFAKPSSRHRASRACCRPPIAVTREPVPASEITLGLQCGGSDGYSGITANPALGAAADLLVRHGGTAILSETPEIYGAEHLLTRRAALRRGRREARRAHPAGGRTTPRCAAREMNNNPSPGNKAGGLTTILEKSLGRGRQGRHHAA